MARRKAQKLGDDEQFLRRSARIKGREHLGYQDGYEDEVRNLRPHLRRRIVPRRRRR